MVGREKYWMVALGVNKLPVCVSSMSPPLCSFFHLAIAASPISSWDSEEEEDDNEVDDEFGWCMGCVKSRRLASPYYPVHRHFLWARRLLNVKYASLSLCSLFL